jgi:hypothetical protein
LRCGPREVGAAEACHDAGCGIEAEWEALETVHARAQAQVRPASRETTWNGIAASRVRLGQHDVNLPPLAVQPSA